MSIVGMIIHKDMINEKDYYIMLADTRVVNKKNSRNILESSYESALKIMELAPNVLIAICGEYQMISVFDDIREDIENNPDISINMDEKFIIDKIINKIQDKHISHKWSATDMFLLIQDEKTKRTKALKFMLPQAQPVELKEGLHLIGGSAQLRADIKNKYQLNFKEQKQCNLYTPDHYANQLLILLKEIEDEDIGNDFITYYVKPDGGIGTLNNYTIFKDDAKIVSVARNDNVWQKRINSDISSELTKDIDLINKKLRQLYKSK